MSTVATEALKWFSASWKAGVDAAHGVGSATESGIVGDIFHTTGYHVSREDNPAGNFSIVRVDDRAGCGPDNAAAAVDMTFTRTSDLVECHLRLRELYKARSTHPAARYLNAWDGWDGVGDAGRYDVAQGGVSYANDTHKWHIHLEFRRRYVEDMEAMRAVLAVVLGRDGEMELTDVVPNTPVGGRNSTVAEVLANVQGYLGRGKSAGGDVWAGSIPETLAAVLSAVKAIQPNTVQVEAAALQGTVDAVIAAVESYLTEHLTAIVREAVEAELAEVRVSSS